MKITQSHSHLNGYEWLLVHHREIWKEIENIIDQVNADKYKTKVSKEKRMRGKLLYSPIQLNAVFTEHFKEGGWQESRTSYWVTDDYKLIRKTILLEPDKQRQEIQAAGRRAIFSYN